MPEPYHSFEQEITPPRSIDDYLETVSQSSTGGSRLRQCLVERWRYYIIFLALGIANSGDSAEMGCMNFLLSSEGFQQDILAKNTQDVDFAKRGAAIAGAHFAGMLISGLLSGALADVRGRRYTLLCGLILNSFVGTSSAFVRDATEFTCGIGLGMVIAGVVTLSAEISPPSNRGRFMTLVASCYTLGFLYTSFWALIIFQSGSGSWRLFMFMNALPTIIALCLVVAFVPESPRFYFARGRLHDAVDAANLIARRIGCNGQDELTEEELRRYLCHAKGIGDARFYATDANKDDNELSFTSQEGVTLIEEIRISLLGIKQVFANRMYRVTIPLQFTYACLTLVTGVATWFTKIFQGLNLQSDAYALSFYHTLAQIPGMMLASGLIDIMGRRRLVLLGFGGGSAILLLFSLFAQSSDTFGNTTRSILALGLACCYSICLCVGWLALDCLSTESFPTKVRSTGRGVCVATGRVAGFSIQFLYAPLINENRISCMLGVAALFAICGVVSSYQTMDTTNVDLQDHWEAGTVVPLPDLNGNGRRKCYSAVQQ